MHATPITNSRRELIELSREKSAPPHSSGAPYPPCGIEAQTTRFTIIEQGRIKVVYAPETAHIRLLPNQSRENAKALFFSVYPRACLRCVEAVE